MRSGGEAAPRGATWRGPSGPQTETEPATIAARRKGAAAGCSDARFWHRFMDPAPGGSVDRTGDGCALSPRPCVEDSGSYGLEPAKAEQTSARARPPESEAVADPTMAGGKKNARRRKAWILFQDESGVSQRPSIRRTWAPKGQTPVLIHAFNWSKMSVCAAIGYCWDGRRSRLFFLSNPTRQLQLGKPDPFSARSPPALAGQEGHSGVGRVTSSQKAAS